MILKDLVKREIIRDDYSEEFLNKMTDKEISDWEHDIKVKLISEGVEEKFPVWNGAYLSKVIDAGILYQLFKLDKHKKISNDKSK